MKIDNEYISLIKWALVYIGIFSMLHYLTLPYTTEKSREVIILDKLPNKDWQDKLNQERIKYYEI